MSKRLLYVLIPLIVIIALLILIVVASRSGDDDGDQQDGERPVTTQQADNGPRPAATPDEAAQSGGEPSADTGSDEGTGPRVLGWLLSGGTGRRLMLFQEGTRPNSLFVYTQAESGSRLQRCGHFYRMPDQSGVIVFIGRERGDLVYVPLDGSEPLSFGQTGRLTCAAPDAMQVFADSDQIAYIDFGDSPRTQDFQTGNLIVYNLSQSTERARISDATAFTINREEILVLRLFPDGAGNATEADLDLWSSAGIQNIITLAPASPPDRDNIECTFTSGAVTRTLNTAHVLLGQRCQPGGSQWRLLNVPLAGGDAVEIASGEPGGGFFTENFTTQIFPATDGSAALIAVPSGLERHIATLQWVNMDGAITPVAEFVPADRLDDLSTEGWHIQLSPDGQWLAFVQESRNREYSLWLLDLSQPGSTGQALITLGANERVFDYRWGPGNRLYYIAGNDQSNALFVVTPGQDPLRIIRGRFTGLEPDSRGEMVTVTAWIPDPDDPNWSLSQIELIDMNGEETQLWTAVNASQEVLPLGVE
ncbi:MAG: hypothetical protein JXJ20_02010 [Anaerolineae bacterium]|nr:hypothetical protein [Anaerolineae bacterium]